MDSDDSRPSSTSTNLSSNFSKLSRPSKDSSGTPIASPISSPENRCYRRPDSNLSNRFKSNSESSSAESSSDSDNDDADVSFERNENPRKSPSLPGNENHSTKERDLSVSPEIKSPRSSKGYQSSPNRSRSNSLERFENSEKVHISHEDLSDVSDLDSEKRDSKQSIDDNINRCSKTEDNTAFAAKVTDSKNASITDLRHKLDEKKNQTKNLDELIECSKNTINGNAQVGDALVDLIKTHDEDALDFEAEEGECQDINKDEVNKEFGSKNIGNEKTESNEQSNSKLENNEELEEGEVSDEDEKRPEETEPKPVCRFYTRGQCTWGMSCRFLHPGVTDKGNYTMFDLVRPVPLPPGANAVPARSSAYPIHPVDYHDYRAERPGLLHRSPGLHHAAANAFVGHHDVRPVNVDSPVVVESAWERGLRTAKEMMRKANKRKEQDMDFEDKKMNLTLSPDELDKDPYYLKDRISPSENMRHMVYQESPGAIYSPPDRYGRGPPMPHYDDVDPYGRSTRYRELPPHRMPQYEDERRIRPTREVIVQRVEPPVGRSDEWNDPWMRSKSPGGRDSSRDHIDKRRRDRRSYSSNSSYSSSTTSQSDSSSDDSSHTLSPADHHRRHYNSSSHKSPVLRRHSGRSIRSPASQSRRPRRSSSGHRSPVSKRKLNVSPNAIYNKSGPYTPMHKRKRDTSISKKLHTEKLKNKRHRSSSSSDSVTTGSSGSSTETDSVSSSSGSTSRSKGRLPPRRSRVIEKTTNERKEARKGESFKKRSPISIEIKKPAAMGVSALSSLSPTHSSLMEKDTKKSRREELLKQLRAVEDAIAKKRSKLV